MAIPVGDYPYNGGKMGDPEASGLDVEAGDSGNLNVTREGNTFIVDSNTDGTASGVHSSVGGTDTLAQGDNSSAGGKGVVSKGKEQNAFGRYNVIDDSNQFAEVVGGGTSGERKNIRTLDWQGNEHIAGEVYPGGGLESYGSKIDAAKAFHVKFTTNDWFNPTTVSMDVTSLQLANAFALGKPVIAELIVVEDGPHYFTESIGFSTLTWPLIFTFRFADNFIAVSVPSSGNPTIRIERSFLRCGRRGPYARSSNVLDDDGTLKFTDISTYIADVNDDPVIEYNGLRYRFQGVKTTGTSTEYWFGVCQSTGQSGSDPTLMFQRVYKNDGTVSSWNKNV